MPLYIEKSGDLVRCYGCLTDSQTMKDRASQLLGSMIGAFVTQKAVNHMKKIRKMQIEDVVRCEQTMAARQGYKSRTNETGRVFFCKEKKGAVKINNKLIFTFILVPF